jgi:hypothetical protein
MSLVGEAIKCGKDIVLLGERADALMVGRKEMANYSPRHPCNLVKWVAPIEQPTATGRGKAIPLLAAARFVREGHLD